MTTKKGVTEKEGVQPPPSKTKIVTSSRARPRSILLPAYEPPRVYVTLEAMKEMTDEVLAHPTIETGWGLYGLKFPDGTILVYGVLQPFDSDISRRVATTQVGGDEMSNAVRWLKSNHELIRTHAKDGEMTPKFGFLFKGHSHHTLGLESYSHTDFRSILEAVKDDGLEVAIGPLANIKDYGYKVGHKLITSWSFIHGETNQSVLQVKSVDEVTFKFYYLDREMVERGMRRPIVVTPILTEKSLVPVMPPLGWQFTHNVEYNEQLRHLANQGCTVKVIHQDDDGNPPNEIKFIIGHKRWGTRKLILVTSWNFPETPPRVTVLPKVVNPVAKPDCPKHLLTDPLWEKGDDFIDLIARLEARGQL